MKIKILVFMLIMISILAHSAIADIELADDSATNFSYDYQELDDDNDDTVTVSFDVELENTGTENETVTLEVGSNEVEYTIEDLESDDSSFDLEAGASRTVTLEITVDLSSGFFDQGNYEDVIYLDVYDSSGSFSTINFDAEVLSMFEVIETFFYIDDEDEGNMNEDDSNDDSSDLDVKPGDEVTMYFNIENLYHKDFRDGDLDFKISIGLDDSDFGDDIDEDVDFTIDAGKDVDKKDDEASIVFEVPIDAEDGDSYELIITFEAEDEERVEYSTEWIANINVEREDEDVRIESMSVYPETVECGESFGLTIEVLNYGADKQRDMFLAVDSEELAIDDDVSFDLGYGHDEDENEETISFQFFVDDEQDEAEYDITIRAYYNDGDDLADSDQISIDVTCSEEDFAEEEEESEEEVETIVLEADSDNSDNSDDETESSTSKVSTVEKSYNSSDVELGLTVVLIILVALAILALIMVGLRKK
jgi:uncharacterized membrane protein